MTKLKLVVLSALIVGLSSAAFANGHGGDPEARKQFHAAKRAAVLAKFDLNKDGKLDQTERVAMHEARVEKRFAMLDTNKDGVVTLAEMKAAKRDGGRGRGHRAKMIK